MKIFEAIRNFLQQIKIGSGSERNFTRQDGSHRKSQGDPIRNPVNTGPGIGFLDGMSTATARFIIDREVGQDQLENYDIKDVANKGRYYLAKIVDQDGKVTNTVLVDKLSRSIHFQKGTIK